LVKSLILGLAAASLVISVGVAQKATKETPAQPNTATPPTTVEPRTSPSADRQNDNKAAAAGDSNQAVATTSASADVPAKGANSFTMGQAQSRLEKQGFSNVSDLQKDNDGVWRGMAEKDGAKQNVWLDYKGNTGSSK
jgi:hypothetical protein